MQEKYVTDEADATAGTQR